MMYSALTTLIYEIRTGEGNKMTVINITGCQMFEDEIVEIIYSDPKIDDVIIIENSDCNGIAKKLNDVGISYQIIPFEKMPLILKDTDRNYIVTINILSISLHGDPASLRDHVYSNVKDISQYSNGILLFYGLCGNVLKQIENDLNSLSCPVSILKDNDGKTVDDCIGAVVGGRKSFLKMVSSFNRKNTLVMTPMWINNWKKMFKYSGFIEHIDDIETAKFVLDTMGYENVVKINNRSPHIKNYKDKVEEFADLFGLNVLEIEGNRKIIHDSYKNFRDTVMTNNCVTSINASNTTRVYPQSRTELQYSQ
ncbi:Protein of unknown function DUF1638 [Methanosalsum zhilinae DSM 4017]|uniref:DUF1638 domain-containing protein n=2 Tax=Methanosalsum zhilinae TaxID=39669 RepID=F7XLZ6_METZD|nr:Protein of unknown function DUF1638 [Methanosalsum zhilinae DSM 4017]